MNSRQNSAAGSRTCCIGERLINAERVSDRGKYGKQRDRLDPVSVKIVQLGVVCEHEIPDVREERDEEQGDDPLDPVSSVTADQADLQNQPVHEIIQNGSIRIEQKIRVGIFFPNLFDRFGVLRFQRCWGSDRRAACRWKKRKSERKNIAYNQRVFSSSPILLSLFWIIQ